MQKPDGLSDAVWQKLKAAIENSQLIEAIKIYREATGVGLKEAKDVIDSLSLGVTPNQTSNKTNGLTDDVWLKIKECLAKSNKIEAIKIYRETTGCGLKEAKEAVEEYASKGRRLSPGLAPKQGCGTFIILFSLLPAIIYFLI